MQVFYTVCIVVVIWALYGYSLAFTGGSDFIGGFSKAFLMGVTPDSKAATFSVDANISELVYVCFQMSLAAITRWSACGRAPTRSARASTSSMTASALTTTELRLTIRLQGVIACAP